MQCEQRAEPGGRLSVVLKFHPYKSLTKEADKTAVLNSSAPGFDKQLLYVKISLNQLNFLSGVRVCDVSASYQVFFSREGILPAASCALVTVTLS